MYTIKLTRGPGYDAPVIATHAVEAGRHIVDVERLAETLIAGNRQISVRDRPTDYRILNHLGRCISSSATTEGSYKRRWHAGRTCWRQAR